MPITIGCRAALGRDGGPVMAALACREDEALADLASWAQAWFAAEGVVRPVLHPLPARYGEDGGAAIAGAAIAGALARAGATLGPAIRWTAGTAPADAAAGDHRPLYEALSLDGPPLAGDAVPIGLVFDADLLRAAALRLAEAGAKPMHALYAVREGTSAANEIFSVR